MQYKDVSLPKSSSTQKLLTYVVGTIFGVHGWFTALLLPRTLLQVLQVFRPGGYGIANRDFWAFGPVDARSRPYYNKIARDYHGQGRFGYAWDDGLGMDLGARIYSNWVTYALLYHLGLRNMAALGYLLMVMTTGCLAAWTWGSSIGLLIALFVAGSPLVVVSYTHKGKPEVFWWGLGLLFVWLGVQGFPLAAGLLWAVIAFVNLPVSVMLLLMAGPGVFVTTLFAGTWLLFVSGMIPGIAKHIVRAVYMQRARQLGSIVSEQSSLWKLPYLPRLMEILFFIPFSLSMIASGYFGNRLILSFTLLVPSIVLYWANWRIIYMNDPQSFHLALWSVGMSFSLATHSWVGLVLILLMAYNHPRLYGMPGHSESNFHGNQRDIPSRLYEMTEFSLKHYPNFQPLVLPQPQKLMSFFAQIPIGSRVMFESRMYIRTDPQFRRFLVWTEDLLPQKKIDLLNEEYTRIAEPELDAKYISAFNVDSLSPSELIHVGQLLGISHVIAYSPEMRQVLEAIGYKEVARTELAQSPEIASLFGVPPVTLALLTSPNGQDVITPAVGWERHGNELSWLARGGQLYTIRYRYHPSFRCTQDGDTLAVNKWHPCTDLPLAFMQVRAAKDGLIMLRFQPGVMI